MADDSLSNLHCNSDNGLGSTRATPSQNHGTQEEHEDLLKILAKIKDIEGKVNHGEVEEIKIVEGLKLIATKCLEHKEKEIPREVLRAMYNRFGSSSKSTPKGVDGFPLFSGSQVNHEYSETRTTSNSDDNLHFTTADASGGDEESNESATDESNDDSNFQNTEWVFVRRLAEKTTAKIKLLKDTIATKDLEILSLKQKLVRLETGTGSQFARLVPETKEKGEEDEEKVKEEESTATFEPVVKLEEVEVKSGEEDEEVMCSFHSKLFIYGETLLDKGTGNKTWKERGIGEARILRHREHQRLRFLMRQEKTMKVIANHAMDPRIVLEPNAGSDRSWVWSCFDFSEGELEEKVFALRFSNSEVANEFKEKYTQYQKEMEQLLAGEDKPDEGGEAGEAAEALAGLKTGDE